MSYQKLLGLKDQISDCEVMRMLGESHKFDIGNVHIQSKKINPSEIIY